jgi:DNA-directed RNA polymerase subunit RPC12/RpoP
VGSDDVKCTECSWQGIEADCEMDENRNLRCPQCGQLVEPDK